VTLDPAVITVLKSTTAPRLGASTLCRRGNPRSCRIAPGDRLIRRAPAAVLAPAHRLPGCLGSLPATSRLHQVIDSFLVAVPTLEICDSRSPDAGAGVLAQLVITEALALLIMGARCAATPSCARQLAAVSIPDRHDRA
jgi:hypothetical protein